MSDEFESIESDPVPYEEFAYQKGRIDALIELCSILIATHPRSTTIAEVFKNRAAAKLRLPPGSECVQAYVSGYDSVAPDLEEISKSFHQDQLAAFSTPQESH